MNKQSFRRFLRAIFTIRNVIIIGGTAILSAIFFNRVKLAFSFVVIGAILLFFSILYNLVSKKNSQMLDESNSELKELNKVRDKLTPVISNIIKVLTSLKQKSQDNSKFMIVSRFMEEIVDFEETIPQIVKSYRKGAEFLRGKDGRINSEIRSLQDKLRNATGDSAKEMYQKALDEKQQTLNEMISIKSNLDECESKLHFILSALQRIDTIIESSELKEAMSDEATRELNQNVEAFSESIRDISKLMKL